MIRRAVIHHDHAVTDLEDRGVFANLPTSATSEFGVNLLSRAAHKVQPCAGAGLRPDGQW